MKVDYEEARKAKETLIKWLEQEVDLNYSEILSNEDANDRLLYIALNQEHHRI